MEMKKVKLIKSLLISAPVIMTPLLANSCNSKDNNKQITATKINDNAQAQPSALTPAFTVDAEYYINALAGTLKTELDSISANVVSAATGNNTLDITSQINTAKAEAKKIATNIPGNIDNISLTFNETGNLKVKENNDTYTLMVYPTFINNNSTQQTLTTTLSLTFDDNTDTRSIENTYDIAKGFKNYTTGLGSMDVNSVYATSDGSKIYAGTDNGIGIGTKESGSNNYRFTNYTQGLNSNKVNAIFASTDENTIFAGTADGLAIGTKQSGSNIYTFVNYTTANGLGSNNVYSIYISRGEDTIYAGTAGGVSVGVKQSGTDNYTFTNHTTGLTSDHIATVYATNGGNTIYAGTIPIGGTSGLSVGTKQEDNSYNFTNYTTANGLGSDTINSVYPASDDSTIYVGTSDGFSVGIKQDNNSYAFKTYKTGLSSNIIRSVYAVGSGSTIYAGTNSGVAIGTKSGDDYTFTNYTTGLGNNTVNAIYSPSAANTIYAGTDGGLSVASANWFAQSNLNYLANNYQAITLTNQNKKSYN